MRLHVFAKRFTAGICGLFLAASIIAAQSPEAPEAVLLTDDFNYSGLLTANGWSVHSGAGTNPMSTTTGLTYTGHPGSGVGNAALVGNAGGEDVNKPLSSEVNTDGATVYFSFLVNVNDAAAAKTGDYFIHIGDRAAADSFISFAARVFARITASGVNFGINNTSTATYGTTNFNKNQTYLIIVKYTISVAGNDPVSMWVLPSGVPASEAAAGTPELTVTDSAGQNVIDAIALRQGSNANSTQQVVDAIRVGTTWADVTGGAPPTATTSPRTFIARLTGAAERPNPVTTNAYGFGRVTLNDAENQITVSANWENLTSNTISGHIHGNATTEQTAGILFDLAPPTGATSGSVTNKTFPVTAQQVADLRAGLWYINIHSSNFTGGEIRGQLVQPTKPADFNGDGLTDYGVLRANGNALQWWISNNGSTNTDQVVTWGILSDYPAPGDYDGDRRTDIAVFRNSGPTPGFYILQSSTSTTRFVRFGQSVTDVPVVADYDGDGRDNVAIFRNAQTAGGQSVFWYFGDVGAVANQQVPVPWGTAGDFPVLGDFTGDGRADFMVQRSGRFYLHPSNGTFDFNNNTNNQIIPFGSSSDSAVSGDFDGDGISDIAVIRTESGAIAWYIRPSSGNGSYYGLTFGAATDNPVQGDYDGDGKTDPATFRNGTTPATFFSRGSMTGNTIVRQYGLAFDQAVINGSLSFSRPEFVE